MVDLYTGRDKIMNAISRYSLEKQRLFLMGARHIYELAELVCDLADLEKDLAEELRESYDKIFSGQGNALSREEKVHLSVYIARILDERLPEKKITVQSFGIPLSPKPDVISYVKNGYSDEAYLAFDKSLEGIFSDYSDSFAAAAQGVYYENAAGCILPVMADDGSIMMGIAKLIQKYDLKKTSLAGIATGGVQNTKFALLTRGIWWDNPKADTLEFNVKTKNGMDIADIVVAAGILGYEDVGHMSIVSSENGEIYESFTLKCGENTSTIPLLIYLAIEFERFDLTGFYSEIKEEQ